MLRVKALKSMELENNKRNTLSLSTLSTLSLSLSAQQIEKGPK